MYIYIYMYTHVSFTQAKGGPRYSGPGMLHRAASCCVSRARDEIGTGLMGT